MDVKMCSGCRKHYQYPVELSKELEKLSCAYRMPTTFKVGVSGCRNSCADLRGNDLSLVGMLKGWKIVVYGCDEALTRVAEELARDLTSQQALEMVGRVLGRYTNSSTTRGLGRHVAMGRMGILRGFA